MLYYIKGLLKLESGQDLVEYALLASFISISSVATLRLLTPLVAGLWDGIRIAIS